MSTCLQERPRRGTARAGRRRHPTGWRFALVVPLVALLAACGAGGEQSPVATDTGRPTTTTDAGPPSGDVAGDVTATVEGTVSMDIAGLAATDLAVIGSSLWATIYDVTSESSVLAELSTDGARLGFVTDGNGDGDSSLLEIDGGAHLAVAGDRLLAIGDGDAYVIDVRRRTGRVLAEFDGAGASSNTRIEDAGWYGDHVVAVSSDSIYLGTVSDDGEWLTYAVDEGHRLSIELGESPEWLEVDGDLAYVKTGPDFYSVVVFDLASGRQLDEVELAGRGRIAAVDGRVVSADVLGTTVQVVEVDAGRASEAITVMDAPSSMVSVGSLVAICSASSGTLMVVDPAAEEVVETVRLPGPGALAVDGDRLWVASFEGASLTAVRLES
jgi:hypothetical protein